MALAIGVAAPPAQALETIETGLIGSPQAGGWPYYIALEKGFFADAGVSLDIVYVPTAAGLVQQLAAGSLDVVNIGIVEPIHAVARGAPVAIIRLTEAVSSYEIVAKPEIKTIQDLKGHTVVIGGLVDINRIYLERVLKAAGLTDKDIDITVVGNTAGRFAALKSGAADATMLAPPVNFFAENAGFHNIGMMIDYTKDLPFGTTDVSLSFAEQHRDAMMRYLKALDRSIAWFNDDANRGEAVKMMVEASKLKPDEVEKSYDFFRKGKFFEPTGKVSRQKLGALIDALVSLGDAQKIEVEKLVLPGVTQISE